jgi:RNA polymerase sigma factor (sigma-70 family)
VDDASAIMGNGTFTIQVDELLLQRARRGEPAAMERLYHTFERPVYNLARRLCRTPHDAEDVLQETFLEVFRSLPGFRGEGSFAGWVRKVAASKALQKLRKGRSGPTETGLDDELANVLPAAGAEPHEHAGARIDLEAALGKLSDTARAVIWLHEVEGWSHDEIAEGWGKSSSFSKSQLSRAYTRLRVWLNPTGRES